VNVQGHGAGSAGLQSALTLATLRFRQRSPTSRPASPVILFAPPLQRKFISHLRASLENIKSIKYNFVLHNKII